MAGTPFALFSTAIEGDPGIITSTEQTPASLTSTKYTSGWFNTERQGTGSHRLAQLAIPVYNPLAPSLSPYLDYSVSSEIGDANATVPFDGAVADITLRTRFKYDHTGTPAAFTMAVIRPGYTAASMASTYYQILLRMESDNTLTLVADKPYAPSYQVIATPDTVFAENTEYILEFRCIFGTSNDQDYWGIFVDNVLVAEGYADLSATGANFSNVVLGPYLGGYAQGGSNVVLSFKDPAFFKNGRPVSGRIQVLVPNAAGTYTAWTGTYTDVDDIPVDEDTTYISTSSANQKESYLFNTGISDGELISAVQVVGRWRRVTTSPNARLFRILGGVEAYLWPGNYNVANTAYNTGITAFMVNNPQTGQPWTKANLDSMELGLHSGVGSTVEIRVTSLVMQAWVSTFIDIAPVVIGLDIPSQVWSIGKALDPVVIRLADPGSTRSIGGISPGPVVIRLRTLPQSAAFPKTVLPTTRGQFWIVSATAPPYPREGYVWISTANPAAPVMYQYLAGGWSALLGGFDEATTRIVFDAGAASTSATPVSLANLTGLSIPADEHIIIEATIVNVNGAFDITGLSVELNNVAIMSGVAMPGTGTGEAGTWRVIIPRRDQAASLGGYSYLTITDSASQTVTALTNVPQNVPITSIELIADPNSTSMELRNVLVRTFKS